MMKKIAFLPMNGSGRVLLTFALVFASARLLAGDGLERVTYRIAYADGRTELREAATERRPDGAYRARFRTIDMTDDMKWIDVISAAAVVPKCDGYWTIGDCRWGRFNRDEETPEPGKKSPQETFTRMWRMPIFGVKTPDRSFVAIVKGMALEQKQYVQVSKGVYSVFARYDLPRIEFRPYEDAVVDFYPLTGEDANYSGMARRYRAYQLTEGGCRPLRERIVGNEALAYATESIFLRCKFGRCDRRTAPKSSWETNMPPVVIDYTFADFRQIMRECRDNGIDKADMCLVGFQRDGHDGPFPDLFPADERFGGEAGMRETIAYGKSLGYRMSIHLNQHNFYKNARRWCEADVSKGPDGKIRRYTTLPGGPVYHSCYEVICNRYFDKDLADMRDLGLNGLVHVDVTSARHPERCHDPRHPNNAAQECAWLRKIACKARAAFGGYSSECGCDHFASDLDNILYQASYPGWGVPVTSLVDGYLPTWSIVYNGIIMSTPFYATLDAGVPREPGGKSDAVGKNRAVFEFLGTPQRTLMKLLEFGGRPMFYYTDYRKDVPAIARVYRAWQPLRHLQKVFIHEHVELAPDVFATRYENGEELVTNYSKETFRYRGREVRPESYEFYTNSGGERMSATGDFRLPEKAVVIADTPGYNSWPMIQAMGSTLVCSYSRDNARPTDGHRINPGSRDSYVRISSDGGRTWSPERTVAADPTVGEVNEGIGLDSTGAALLWVRCWGKERRHELYRTLDGVSLEKIAAISPDPFPMQVMDPVRIAGLGLVSPWFAGHYRKDGVNSWGLLVSADDGRTWTQRVIEAGLSVREWVTEPSLVDLGGGRLLIVGRCEQGLGTQFQVTSVDGGKTWKKARTNIGDVKESTPSLIYDRGTGLLANYYYHRGARQLKRRVVSADFIFDHPDAWPAPEVLDTGFEIRPHDAGNVKATRLGSTDCCAWYSGTSSNAAVVVTLVSKP